MRQADQTRDMKVMINPGLTDYSDFQIGTLCVDEFSRFKRAIRGWGEAPRHRDWKCIYLQNNNNEIPTEKEECHRS
jgi:hypothetical protein